MCIALLIEPQGIEIRMKELIIQRHFLLLIEPQGIEIVNSIANPVSIL